MNDTRVRAAVTVAVVGLLIPGVLAGVMIAHKSADDVIKVVSLFLPVVGTLVGAFLGVQVAAAGKEDAEKRAVAAESKAERAIAKLPPTEAQAVLDGV